MTDKPTTTTALDAAALTPAQLDGTACVVCGVDYTTTPDLIPNVPAGMVDGGQVFACTTCMPSAAGGTR